MLDRETYLAVNYPDGTPDPWTAEHEIEMPDEFRWDAPTTAVFRHFTIVR
jgi:hypothetical protein